MTKNVLIALALVGILIYFIREATPGQQAYVAQVHKLRREKNQNFRLSPESPLSVEQRQAFDSLRYFPVDPTLRVTATLVPSPPSAPVLLQMSDAQTERYQRWGLAKFFINKKPLVLTLFRRAAGNDSTLFLPFTDLSNGRETYGGGRYLDLPLPGPDAENAELDFNQAYNPYCAYNAGYSCPVPPAENRLPVAVPAGEKSFHD